MGARQIYEALKDQIVKGVYGKNALLPSSRGLAAELDVSRTTVTAAYEQLAAEGFVDLRQGARPRAMPASIDQLGTKRSPEHHPRGQLSSYGKRLKAIPPRPKVLQPWLISVTATWLPRIFQFLRFLRFLHRKGAPRTGHTSIQASAAFNIRSLGLNPGSICPRIIALRNSEPPRRGWVVCPIAKLRFEGRPP